MTRIITIALTLFLGLTCLAGATDRLSAEPGNPWDWTERALQKDGFETDTDSLMKIAKSRQEESAGLSAIAVLGWRGEQKAKGLLRELLLEGDDELVRQEAALALARLGEDDGLQALIQFFFEEEGDGKAYLATRLAELGQDVGYSQTIELSNSPTPQVRGYSLRSLFVLSKLVRDLPERSRELADRICALSQDADLGVRREFLVQASGAVEASLREMCLESEVRRMASEEEDVELREIAERLLVSWRFHQEPKQEGGQHED